MKLSDKTILFLGSLTLYGFSLLSFLIIYILAPKVSYYELVSTGEHLFLQILIGVLFAGSSFLVINAFLNKNYFPDLFNNVLSFAKQLNWIQVTFISFAAGVGEELLFRVAIQNFLGIWFTAFLFVFIHGYFNLKNPFVFLYGLIMTLISAGFGYLYIHYGIVSSITAHFLIDLFIFIALKSYKTKPDTIETQ